MKNKIIGILNQLINSFNWKDLLHVRRGMIEGAATRIMEQLGECYVEKVPNLSELDEKNKGEFINDFIQLTAKNVLSVFVALGLETHIEAKVVNDADGAKYQYSFKKLPPHPKEEQSCITCHYLDSDSRQCDKCDDAYCNWEPPHILSKEETDWNKLREQYFEECCEIKAECYVPPPMDVPKSMKRVAMAPHDLFEWFKKRLSNPLKEECPNCKETSDECACVRNKCVECGKPVGNITFTVCDDCWNNGKPKDSVEETRAIQKQDDKYHLACQNCGTTSQPLQMIPFRNDNHVVGLLTCCSECTDDLYGQRFDRECKFLPDPPTVETKKD